MTVIVPTVLGTFMSNKKWRRRLKWCSIVSCVLFLILALVAWRLWSGRHVAQWQLLKHVVEIENTGVETDNVQLLGWNLAILGRDHEIRSLDFHPQFDLPPLQIDHSKLKLNIVPWADGLKQVAVQHRIVMVMEDHFVSKHREMIAATLPTFHAAGFTHFAAEGIGESQAALVRRGFPAVTTGFYTSDPQFGNLLRRALDLKFKVLGYDFRPFSHEGREEYAATQLAKLLNEKSKTKLVVHAGFAHVFKHETDLGQLWLAARLWEKSGIEPFTIWQWSAMRDGHEYRVVAEAIAEQQDFDQPVLLMPPPDTSSGLRNVPRVDAILVHPPDNSTAPAARTVLFAESMERITGRWLTKQWPIIIAAHKQGEPTTAIPLDQVLLRKREEEFVLWIPSSVKYDLVAYDQAGIVDSEVVRDGDLLKIRAQ